jgi:hypothetical protein
VTHLGVGEEAAKGKNLQSSIPFIGGRKRRGGSGPTYRQRQAHGKRFCRAMARRQPPTLVSVHVGMVGF